MMRKMEKVNEMISNVEENVKSKVSKLCLNLADNIGASEQICPLFFYEPKKPEKSE